MATDEPLKAAVEATGGSGSCRAACERAAAEVAAPSAERWRECAVAAWMLGHLDLSQERCQDLEPAVRAILDGRQPNDLPVDSIGRLVVISGGAGFSLAVAAGIAVTRSSGGQARGPVYVCALVALVGIMTFAFTTMALLVALRPLIVPFLVWLDKQRLMRARECAAETLGRWRNSRSLGSLALAVSGGNRGLRQEARIAVRRVLAAARPEDYGVLSPGSQVAVCNLTACGPSSFAVEVLSGVGRVCGGPALPLVQKIAEHAPDLEVREAAQAILPVLEARDRAERAERNLLRAADGPQQHKTLVRAAGRPESADSSSLLRVAPDTEALNGMTR